MKTRLTQEQQEYILKNCEFMTPSKIAEFLGVKYESVSHFMKVNGKWETRIKGRPIFSDDDIEYIKTHYRDTPYKDIAKMLGFTERQIRGKINNMGLTKIREFDKSYFENIDTPLKAYFLGFIYADGWVVFNEELCTYEFGIELQSGDSYILEKLKAEIGNVHEITFDAPGQEMILGRLCNVQEHAKLRVYSKKFVSDLIGHGIETNKSSKSVVPHVNDELFFDFLRGYIDGDGYFTKQRKNALMMGLVCASREVLEYLQSRLESFGIQTQIYTELPKKHILMCTNKENMTKLVSRLYYKGDLLYLTRKYDKVKHLLCPAA